MKILVTGGSRGIGRACVEYFSSLGHTVAFIYKSSYDNARSLSKSTGAVAICADISDGESAKAAVFAAKAKLGEIDVLINNAGISQIKLFSDITDNDWKTLIDTNLSSAFYITREVSRLMVAQKGGSIINIGSMWGKVGASCEVHYSASKAALRGFTMSLAKELGPSGIRVNCIEPGVIDTDMNKELSSETLSELCEDTPLCRTGKPIEVAYLCDFLASERAAFITGQIIGIDGGFAI